MVRAFALLACLLLPAIAFASKPHEIKGGPFSEDRQTGIGSPAWSGGGRAPASTSPIFFDGSRTLPLCVAYGSNVYLKALDEVMTFCFSTTTTITITAPLATATDWGNVATSSTTRRRSCFTLAAGAERWAVPLQQDVESAFPENALRLCRASINSSYRIGYGRDLADAPALRPYCSSGSDCLEAGASEGGVLTSAQCPSSTAGESDRRSLGCVFVLTRPRSASDFIAEVYR